MGANKVTLMVVKENKFGELEYIPDMIFEPNIDNYYYSFQI